jgi:hypothetical protein
MSASSESYSDDLHPEGPSKRKERDMAMAGEADRVSVLMRYSVVIASFICVSISVRQIVTAQHLSMGCFVLRRSGQYRLEISALVSGVIIYQLKCSLSLDNGGSSRNFRLIFASYCSCSLRRFSGFG